MKRFAFLGLLLLTASCSSTDDPKTSEEALPEVDCTKETVPKFSEVTIFQKTCVTCHSSAKTGDARKGAGAEAAPVTINYDTYAAAKANAESAAEELFEGDRGAMPPEDSGLDAATEAEKHQVLVWAQCGTPE
jgi:uncharacterized membrane protein